MTRYIAALPQGLQSHPDAKGKASLVRSMIDEDVVEAAKATELPAPIARLFSDPPPVSAWIPEVHSNAALLLIQDLKKLNRIGYEKLVYDRMKALLGGPLYRILFRLSSPTFLMRSAAQRWRSFHKGTTFTVERAKAQSASMHIDFPTQLWNADHAVGLIAALRVSLDMSGAVNPDLELVVVEPEHIRFDAHWGR